MNIFANSTPNYTLGVPGIPNTTTNPTNPTTPISISQFSGTSKAVTVVEYMLAGNVIGNMSTSGGTELTSIRTVDDGSASIGTVGFSFLVLIIIIIYIGVLIEYYNLGLM